MGRIWAVTRYTLAQCLRTKVAAVFIILMLAALVAIPATLKGDGTLAGRIRTFLAYSMGATTLLLSLVTVFLSVGLIAGDVQAKHVFLLATKPVARWQYILGRWVGIVMLDAMLLAVAACAVYLTAQHLRTGEAINREDRIALENEVFTARAKLSPEPMTDIEDRMLDERKKSLGEDGLKEAVRQRVKEAGGRISEQEARRQVEADMRKSVREGLQAVPPGGRGSRAWRFKDVNPVGIAVTGAGRILACRRQHRIYVEAKPDVIRQIADAREVRIEGLRPRRLAVQADRFLAVLDELGQGAEGLADLSMGGRLGLAITTQKGRLVPATGRLLRRETELVLWMECDQAIAERLIVSSFIAIEGIDARVESVDGRQLQARVFAAEAARAGDRLAIAARPVSVAIHPTVQFAYKLTPASNVPGDAVWAYLAAGSPSAAAPPYEEDRSDPVRIQTTFNIPDRMVGKERDLYVEYTNLSPFEISILHKDVWLFCRTGSFGWNFVRVSLLALARLMFIAGLGVFAASFLSFPVGCLVCFSLLPFSLARGFLAESLSLPVGRPSDLGPLLPIGRATLKVMEVLVPDFAQNSPSDLLVDAVYVGWSQIGTTALLTVGVRAFLAVAIACLIFHKRELARVQV